MAIGTWGWIALVGGGAAAAALLAGGSSSKPTITHFVGVAPSSSPPPKPDTPSGSISTGDDSGRAWFTASINRNEVREAEQEILSIENFANGKIVADVYEQVEPPDDVHWFEATACGASRWILTFENGIMVGAVQSVDTPKCLAGARPISRAYLRTLRWVQRGPDVFLQLITASGLWKANDYPRPWGPGSPANWRWDNDMVESGHALVDVLWKVG